jgi:hypothetical protein
VRRCSGSAAVLTVERYNPNMGDLNPVSLRLHPRRVIFYIMNGKSTQFLPYLQQKSVVIASE